MQLLLLLLHATELLGATSAYISPHHKDGLVLVLWISLSLIHTFSTYSLGQSGVRLSKTELGGGGVTGVISADNFLLNHYGVHRRHPCSLAGTLFLS